MIGAVRMCEGFEVGDASIQPGVGWGGGVVSLGRYSAWRVQFALTPPAVSKVCLGSL